MTRKLYWEEPYNRKFTGRVVSVEGPKVVLNKTLFYPRGGGVSGDTGLLGRVRVLEAVKEGPNIVHVLASTPDFLVHSEVEGEIDWDRRHKLMRMHTAGHLLSSLFYTKANCLITGNQIEVDRSRMDFSLESFDRQQIEGFVIEANDVIRKNALVKTYFLARNEALKHPEMVKLAEATPPAEDPLRIVEIEGVDRQADGGLHVQHLNEIGRVQLLKLENKGKTNRRLYYDVLNSQILRVYHPL